MSAPAFQGGLKMATTLNHLREAMGSGKLQVRVGFLEGSTCGGGIHGEAEGSAPDIAFIQEYGAPAANIPPRPFFRNMITKRSSTWGKTLLNFLKHRKYSAREALMDTGLVMGEQLQISIIQTNDPPNADSPTARKGFNNPLIWSRNMLRAVEAEVDGQRKASNGSA